MAVPVCRTVNDMWLKIAKYRLVFFERSGHLPSYEEPAKYRTVLEGFLDGR